MFEGKTWWITGASSGIGASLSAALGIAGANLILSGRNQAVLNEMANRISARSLVLPFEATAFNQIPEIVGRAWDWATNLGGGVDGLVNNAGISQRSLALDTAFEVYRRIIDVDLLAPIALTQAILPRMAKVGHGHLVAISSIAGIVGAPMRSAYSAAKHGVIGYCDSIRAETDHLGVRVLVVAPGPVRTNIAKNALNATASARGESDPSIENGMDPDSVADRILNALRSGERELILAHGMELEAAQLRRSDPNALFDMFANMVASGYARQFEPTKEN